MIFIYGCNSSSTNNPVTPTTITVSGHVLDYYGTPISPAVTVYISGKTASTAGDGSFTISGVSTPYDAYVMNPNVGVFVIKGLTIANPYLQGSLSVSSINAITVTVPVVPIGTKATVIFQDTVTGKVSGFGQILAGQTVGTIAMGGTNGQTVAGKVFVIEYAISGGVVSSYNGYAEQPLTFTFGGAANVTFTSLTGGLGQTTVSGTVNSSGGTSLVAQLYLNFSSKNNIVHRGGFIQSIAITGNTGTFSFNVPTGTTSAAQINVVAFSQLPTVTQRMKTLTAGTTGAVISIDTITSLLTPGNNATGVDTTTQFTFTTGGGNGIHHIKVTPAGPSGYLFVFITKGTSFTIPNLAAYGYSLGTTAQFTWSDDAKTMDVNSTDDICTQFGDLNPSIMATTQSASLNFTSK